MVDNIVDLYTFLFYWRQFFWFGWRVIACSDVRRKVLAKRLRTC